MNSFKNQLIVLFLCCASYVSAQQKEVTIEKEITLNGDAGDQLLLAKNINGPIEVLGYDGNTVKVVIKKVIKADNEAEVEKGMKEFDFTIRQKNNRVVIRPEAPFIQYRENEDGHLQINGCGNNYGPKYDFYGEFVIKVPREMMVNISTINRGDVKVSNVQTSVLEVGNINGAIRLDNVTGQSKISTINGNIDVVYDENPGLKSSYSTINGRITLHCVKNLQADVSFETMHGDFYTEFDVTDVVSNTTKSRKTGKNNVAYVIKSNPVMRIGKGGPLYNFKTLNGDVYVKKI